MPLYVTVSQGPRADLAKPLLASSDQTVVVAVLDAIRRLEEHERCKEHGDVGDDPDAPTVRVVRRRGSDDLTA